jgi:hypothetical protein
VAKGLLVSYSGYPCALSSFFPDNGLASLAAVLRAAGHECMVLDFNTAETIARIVDAPLGAALRAIMPRLVAGPPSPEAIAELTELSRRIGTGAAAVTAEVAQDVAARVVRERYDFVGFKLWTGDGFEASLRIAGHIRERAPSVRLFAGGPAVHYCDATVAREAPVFDAVIDGDGEEALLELAAWAEGRRSLEGIPNRVTASGETTAHAVTDLASLPIPEYGPEVYPSVAAGQKLRLFCLDESRGCPMRCAFCINCCIEGTTWRTRSVQQVLAEIRGFRERHRSRAFRLAGTYSPPRLVREICRGIVDEKLEVEFGVSLHAGGVQDDLPALLREAGCHGVFMGVESGSDEILSRAMHKSTTAARLHESIAALQRADLFVAGSFIYPAPFETAETAAETRKLIDALFVGRSRASVIAIYPGLIPRTEWWRDRDHYGFELHVPEEEYRRMVLRCKIRHVLPPTLWEAVPYSLGGRRQPELAKLNAELQQTLREAGVCVNLPDHDAQVGRSIGETPQRFQMILRQMLFCADAEGLQTMLDRANEALLP